MASLTALGLFHTVISVLAIPVGLFAFLRDGKIDPRNRFGKFYVELMLVASFTAFGIAHTGHFGVGHVLTVITLALLSLGFLAGYVKSFGRIGPYVETFSYSASYFFLMFFATTETLTRFPLAHPFATSAEDAALLPVRLGLLAALVVGFGYQVFELWGTERLQAGLTSQPIRVVSSRVVPFQKK